MSFFISYSSKDKEVADHVFDQIKAAGQNVWMDRQGLETGANWAEEIATAIEDSESFVILLSENSMNSSFVKKELHYALSANRKVLPILLQGTKVSKEFQFLLGSIHIFEMSDSSSSLPFLKAPKPTTVKVEEKSPSESPELDQTLDNPEHWIFTKQVISNALSGEDLLKLEKFKYVESRAETLLRVELTALFRYFEYNTKKISKAERNPGLPLGIEPRPIDEQYISNNYFIHDQRKVGNVLEYIPSEFGVYKNCGGCRGAGQQTCGYCHGRGEQRCKTCNGSGWSKSEGGDCTWCDGSGKNSCSYCGDSGREKCDKCSGFGGESLFWKISVKESEYTLEAARHRFGKIYSENFESSFAKHEGDRPWEHFPLKKKTNEFKPADMSGIALEDKSSVEKLSKLCEKQILANREYNVDYFIGVKGAYTKAKAVTMKVLDDSGEVNHVPYFGLQNSFALNKKIFKSFPKGLISSKHYKALVQEADEQKALESMSEEEREKYFEAKEQKKIKELAELANDSKIHAKDAVEKRFEKRAEYHKKRKKAVLKASVFGAASFLLFAIAGLEIAYKVGWIDMSEKIKSDVQTSKNDVQALKKLVSTEKDEKEKIAQDLPKSSPSPAKVAKAPSKSNKARDSFLADKKDLQSKLDTKTYPMNKFAKLGKVFLAKHEAFSKDKFYLEIKSIVWGVQEYLQMDRVEKVIEIFSDRSRASKQAYQSFCFYARNQNATEGWRNRYRESFFEKMKSHPWYKKLPRESLKASALIALENHKVNAAEIKKRVDSVHSYHCSL